MTWRSELAILTTMLLKLVLSASLIAATGASVTAPRPEENMAVPSLPATEAPDKSSTGASFTAVIAIVWVLLELSKPSVTVTVN